MIMILYLDQALTTENTETQGPASGDTRKTGTAKMARRITVIHVLQTSSHLSGSRLACNGGHQMPAGIAFTLLGPAMSPEVRAIGAYPEVHLNSCVHEFIPERSTTK